MFDMYYPARQQFYFFNPARYPKKLPAPGLGYQKKSLRKSLKHHLYYRSGAGNFFGDRAWGKK